MLKKFLHKLWRIQKISCTIKLWGKKNHALENCPTPVKKNNVANMQRFPLRLRCELINQVNEFSIKAPLTDFLKSIKFRISRDEYFAWNALLKAFEIFQYPLCGYSRYLFQSVFTKHWKFLVQTFCCGVPIADYFVIYYRGIRQSFYVPMMYTLQIGPVSFPKNS